LDPYTSSASTTPVGTFLLVPSAAIDEASYQRGLLAARKLHRRNGSPR